MRDSSQLISVLVKWCLKRLNENVLNILILYTIIFPGSLFNGIDNEGGLFTELLLIFLTMDLIFDGLFFKLVCKKESGIEQWLK